MASSCHAPTEATVLVSMGRVGESEVRVSIDKHAPAGKGKAKKRASIDSQKHEEHSADRNIKHGAFSISKAGYPAKFVWIPGKIKITPDVVGKIMSHWDRPYPSLMLRFKSGFAHPENLLTEDVVQQYVERHHPSLNRLYEKFKAIRENISDGEITNMLNSVLHRQLVSLVRQIVNVAALNDVWLVVHGRPTGIAVILEQVLEECEPMPVVLVVDAPRKAGYTSVKKNLKLSTKSLEKLAPLDPNEKPWTKESIRKTFGTLLVDEGKLRREVHQPDGQLGDDHEGNNTEGMGRSSFTNNTEAIFELGNQSLEKEVIDLGPFLPATPVHVDNSTEDVLVYGGLQDERFWKHQQPEHYILRDDRQKDLQDMYRDAIEKQLKETVRLSSEITDKIEKLRKPFDDDCDYVEKIESEFWTDKKAWPQSSAKEPDAWDVRFPQFMFRGGTHYLLFEDEATSSPATVLNNFGPKGSLFVGGGDSTIDDIIESWRDGDPTVLIDNTGRVTQAMAALHYDILDHFVNDKNLEKTRTSGRMGDQDIPPFIWKFVREFAVDQEKRKKTMRVQDVIETFHLYRHRHSILRLTCTCLDPLDINLNERDVLAQISQCFSSSRCVSTNLAGEQANHQAVATAWQLHSQLYETCVQNKKKADRCGTALLTLSLISLFVSLGLLMKETGDLEIYVDSHVEEVHLVLEFLVIILPAFSGLINTVSSRMKYATKWGLMKRASCIIEAEIFRFRTRVQDYAVVSAGAGSGSEQKFSNRKSREQQVRQRFASKVLDTFHSHLAEIGEASLIQVREFDRSTELKFDIESYARAAQFVTICQFGADPTKLIEKKSHLTRRNSIVTKHSKAAVHARQIGKALEPEAPPKLRRSFTESSDEYRPLNDKSRNVEFEFGFLGADSYFQARLLPALHTMTTDAYLLQRLISVSEVLLGVCAALGTIAGALNEPMLVCALVSIGVCMDSYVKQQGYNNRLVTTNAGVRSLTKLNMGWTSKSPISQAKVSTITDMVEETENIRLSVINAWTGGIQAGQGSKKDRPQHGEDGEGGDDNGGATQGNKPNVPPASKKSTNATSTSQ